MSPADELSEALANVSRFAHHGMAAAVISDAAFDALRLDGTPAPSLGCEVPDGVPTFTVLGWPVVRRSEWMAAD